MESISDTLTSEDIEKLAEPSMDDISLKETELNQMYEQKEAIKIEQFEQQ